MRRHAGQNTPSKQIRTQPTPRSGSRPASPLPPSALSNPYQPGLSRWPPGYAQGINYLPKAAYRGGLYTLQSQILDGSPTLKTPAAHWSVAPDVITSLMSIDADIYVVLPAGARPIFRAGSIDPGATASTAQLTAALTRHYGYSQVTGRKGPHVKLVKPNAPNIHLPRNRPVVSPGMVKQVLGVFGGYPLSRLPDLLRGEIPAPTSSPY